MNGLSRKIYLEMDAPTEADNRSAQRRILDALQQRFLQEGGTDSAGIHMNLRTLQSLYPLCEKAGWKITASLAWDGARWEVVRLEGGDTADVHFGIAIDLGSTTVVGSLINCETKTEVSQASRYNRQIAFGTDILNRIFYAKDKPQELEEIRTATIESICEVCRELVEAQGISMDDCMEMVVSGNTTMTHFLLGMDAFCVFSTPYAVRADRPDFLPARELGLDLPGYVYCYPGKSNYLGGDIVSGMIATGLYESRDVCAFFDIGTNGELVVGSRDFLLCGAGAAGPALEGGVVKTGMRAMDGAVDRVWMEQGRLAVHVMGDVQAAGICGSGIVDLIAELFLHGWIDLRGKFVPEKSSAIGLHEGHMAVAYAPGLWFYQEDIDEFIRTKAAAHTMVQIMMQESGFTMADIARFYVAGAFGKHVSKESAIAIGMYPDMERERIVHAGNSSLEGAKKLLLDRSLLAVIDEILEKMIYVQFGAIENFLHEMVAAQALPHTNLDLYPTVAKRLHEIND